MKSRLLKNSVFLQIGIIFLFVGCGLLSNTNLVKDHVDDLDPSLTLGEALDNYKYFIKTEWKEFTTQRGQEMVEFNGYYNEKDIVVRIQFLINKDWVEDEDGNMFRLGFQGYKFKNQEDSESEPLNSLINDIYKNKEIFRFTYIENPNPTGSSETFDNSIVLEDFPSDFVEFINNFSSNSTFQLKHIKFPLSNFGLDKPAPLKDSWKFIGSDEIFMGSRRTEDGNEVVGRFEILGNSKISYGLGYPESEWIYYMTFEKSNNGWNLVEYQDYNMNDF
ncbi:MAG: hypothetical protein WCY89_09165 [Flavobacteriaceae bacterium]